MSGLVIGAGSMGASRLIWFNKKMVRLGAARLGLAWQCMAVPGSARPGKATGDHPPKF